MTRKEVYTNLMDKTTPSQGSIDRLKALSRSPIKSPKRLKRILPLVAVILVLSVVLTITATAKYSFSSIFGGMFSGDGKTEVVVPNSIEIYSGSDLLNFKCLGITGGTEYDCCMAYEITRKDNKPLVTCINNNEPQFDNVSIHLSDNNIDVSYSMSEYLYFKDNKTIIFYENLYRLGKELNGAEYFGIYNGLKFKGIKEYKDIYLTDKNELSKFKDKYSLAPDESLVAVYDEKTNRYQLAVEGDFICNNDMWAEFTLDYKPSYVQGEIKSDSLNIESATATEFGITIVGNGTDEEYENNLLSKGIATLKDGTEISLQENTSFFVGDYKGGKGQFVINLYYKVKNQDKMQIIDYTELKSVTLDGVTISF